MPSWPKQRAGLQSRPPRVVNAACLRWNNLAREAIERVVRPLRAAELGDLGTLALSAISIRGISVFVERHMTGRGSRGGVRADAEFVLVGRLNAMLFGCMLHWGRYGIHNHGGMGGLGSLTRLHKMNINNECDTSAKVNGIFLGVVKRIKHYIDGKPKHVVRGYK